MVLALVSGYDHRTTKEIGYLSERTYMYGTPELEPITDVGCEDGLACRVAEALAQLEITMSEVTPW
jgi:hypothetical protein